MIVVKTSALKRAKRAVWAKVSRFSLAALIAVSGLTVAAPAFLATANATGATAVTVSPANPGNWTTDDTRPGGVTTYTADSSAPGSDGALLLTTNNTTSAKAQYTQYFAPVSLSSINELSYQTKQNASATGTEFAGADPAYQLYVYLNGTFDTLTYEPYVNEGNAAIHQGTWQTWDVSAGEFYSSHTIAGVGGSVETSQGQYVYTLAQLKSLFPDNNSTFVFGVGVNVGSNNPNYNVEADTLDFNGTIYNFADVLAAPTNLTAKFQYDATSLNNGAYLNKTAEPHNNNLVLNWTASAGDVSGYRVHVVYPDGTSNTFWQGSNTNAWLATVDGFGQHGQGKYTYTVAAANTHYLVGAYSQPFVLYYDTQIPTAHFTSAAKQYVNGNFAVSGTAQDNVGLKSVFFDVRSQDGSTWEAGCVAGTEVLTYSGTNNQNATISCTINTANLTEGTTYMLRIHAGDNAGYGNVNSDAIRYFTVDKTAPVITSISPTPGSVLGGTQTFKVTATDAHANYIYVELNKNGKWMTDSTKSGHEGATTSTLTYDTSKLADGTYTIKVDAVDKAGNTTEANYTYIFDNTAPVATITSPLAGTTVNKIVTLSGTVTDTHPDHYYFVVKDANGNVVAHAGASGVIYAATVADWTWDTTTVKDGTYTVDLEARDAAGNKGAQSVATETVKVDNTAPVVTYSSTTDSSTTPTITGTVNDPTATIAVVVNGIPGAATNNGDGTWSFAVPASDGLQSGNTYTVTVSATDGVGNVSAQTIASEGSLIISPLIAAPTVLTTHATTLTTTTTTTTTTSTNSNTDPSNSNTGVLGDSTTTPSTTNTSSDQGVKGDSTTNNTTSTTKKGGLAWYWWLLILLIVAAIIWWIVAAARRKSDDA